MNHAAGTVDSRRVWTSDVWVMSYSVAKPFAAMVVLSVVSEGTVGRGDPVMSVWPD